MTTKTYRAGGAGMTVRFAVGTCSLGALLAATTDQGVCAIFLGNRSEQLPHDLKHWLPKAELIGPDVGTQDTLAAATLLVENPGRRYELPLALHGTRFQRRVWKLLRRIPVGSTLTYTELALRLGRPGAVRSVWQAIHTNPIAVAIPCHRIVHANGTLGGCRWGDARQRELLAREVGLRRTHMTPGVVDITA